MDAELYHSFIGAAKPLTNDDIIKAAKDNGLNPAIIQACMDVESSGKGFNNDGSPVILFERHLFHRYTAGKFDESHPSISSSTPGGYGAGGFHQYERLLEAIECDRIAALRAASWGRFQCLGENAKLIGYANVEDMVSVFKDNELSHLYGFIDYCKKTSCMTALKKNPPDFYSFAKAYNGQASVGYDIKMAAAYDKFLHNPIAPGNSAPRTEPDVHAATLQFDSMGEAVKELQRRLGATGYMQTGLFQTETKAAVVAFQRASGLSPVDGIVGPITMAAIQKLPNTGQ